MQGRSLHAALGGVGIPVSRHHGRPQDAGRRAPGRCHRAVCLRGSRLRLAQPGPPGRGGAARPQAPPTAPGGGACPSRDGAAERERPAPREEARAATRPARCWSCPAARALCTRGVSGPRPLARRSRARRQRERPQDGRRRRRRRRGRRR